MTSTGCRNYGGITMNGGVNDTITGYPTIASPGNDQLINYSQTRSMMPQVFWFSQSNGTGFIMGGSSQTPNNTAMLIT